MGIVINNASFILRNSSFLESYPSPGIGQIFRVSGVSTTSSSLSYININYTQQSTPNINTGSAPYYIVALSGSLNDGLAYDNFQQGVLAYINTFITASITGSSFTEELITTAGSGNWTKPLGVTQVLVECLGGGGAGGGSTVNNGAGGGGAGGQYSRKLIIYSPASISIPYTIAASVAGTTGNGATGNDTTWDTNIVVAKGGGGGLADQVSELNPIGGGSTASLASGVGDVIYSGENGFGGSYDSTGAAGVPGTLGGYGGNGAGSTGQQNRLELGGFGGESFFVDTGGVNGLPGENYGGAGAGAGRVSSGPSRSGGAGAQGLIRIIYR